MPDPRKPSEKPLFQVQTLFGGPMHCEPCGNFAHADTRAQQKVAPYQHILVFAGRQQSSESLVCMWSKQP